MSQKVYVLISDHSDHGISVNVFATQELAREELRDILSSDYTKEEVEQARKNNWIDDDYAYMALCEDTYTIDEHTIITGGNHEAEAPISEAGTNDRNGLEEASNQAVLADEGPR